MRERPPPGPVLFAAGFIAAAMTGCEKESDIRPERVVAEPVEEQPFPIYGNYVATVRASMEVEVRARVSGFVEEIPFQEGGAVEAGDLLYRIDDRPYRARVNRLEAELRSADSALRKAKRDLARIEPLYEKDAASRLDLDNARADVETSEAAVIAATAALEEAELELTYTKVQSPSAGLIGESLVDVGALVGERGASLLTTVQQVDPVHIEFQMTTLDYLDARANRKNHDERERANVEGSAVEGFVRITLPSDEEYTFRGDIDFTAPQVDPDTGTFSVRAVVPNPNRTLLPGQYVTIRMELDRIDSALTVPERALQIEQGGSFLMVAMPDDTVERRFVTLGPARGDVVVIAKGVAAGERIITEGVQKVQHDDPVEVFTPEGYEEFLSGNTAEEDEGS